MVLELAQLLLLGVSVLQLTDYSLLCFTEYPRGRRRRRRRRASLELSTSVCVCVCALTSPCSQQMSAKFQPHSALFSASL